MEDRPVSTAGVVRSEKASIGNRAIMTGQHLQASSFPGLLCAGQKTVVPSSRRLDLDSSLPDILATFLDLPYPVLLESALMAHGLGRFSYLSADPFLVLRSRGSHVEIAFRGAAEQLEANPFLVLQGLLRQFSLLMPLPGLPPFQGGAVGYMAYELGHHLEKLPHRASNDLGLPEMSIAFYDWVIARDHLSNATWALATGLPEGSVAKAQERLAWLERRLSRVASSSEQPFPKATNLASNFSHQGYIEAVRAVKEYILSGDVYQVNLSQRLQASIACSPWELYLRLRQVNPAPFAAYLHYPEVDVLSASPEEFLHLQDGVVRSRPMKGTRPRGRGLREDLAMASQLRASEKDRAENVMIVDLLRNDLGKVCIPGSVEVPALFAIEQYPTVFQMVSTVQGRLRQGLDAVAVLQACFPGGSVTGAPKIRAMEIIDELEPTQRSVYCGVIGYIGFDGSMLASIPIRILLVKGQTAYFQVGGGIVADSDPEAEYEETLHKARGSLKALGLHD